MGGGKVITRLNWNCSAARIGQQMAGNKVRLVIGIQRAPNWFSHAGKRLGSCASRENRQQRFGGGVLRWLHLHYPLPHCSEGPLDHLFFFSAAQEMTSMMAFLRCQELFPQIARVIPNLPQPGPNQVHIPWLETKLKTQISWVSRPGWTQALM